MTNFIIKINYLSHILLQPKYRFLITILIYFIFYYVNIIKYNSTSTLLFCEEAGNPDEKRIEGTILFLSFCFLWLFITTSISASADLIAPDITSFDVITPNFEFPTNTANTVSFETNFSNFDLSNIPNKDLFYHLIQNEEKFFFVRHDPETIKTLIAIWDEMAPNAELPPKLQLWAELNNIPIKRQMNCWGMQYEIE